MVLILFEILTGILDSLLSASGTYVGIVADSAKQPTLFITQADSELILFSTNTIYYLYYIYITLNFNKRYIKNYVLFMCNVNFQQATLGWSILCTYPLLQLQILYNYYVCLHAVDVLSM